MSSGLSPISRDIAVLSRAGYPLIYVLTHEEARARELIEEAAAAAKKSVAEWSCARGFEGDEGPALGDPELALRRIERSEDPALFVLLDFHPYLKDPGTVRRLREAMVACTPRRQSIVIVAPILVLPPELQKDTTILDLPLPNTEELAEELARVAQSERQRPESLAVDRAVRAALGLSLLQASRVFRKVLVLKKRLADEDIPLVLEEKKNVLRASEALTFHELDDKIDDVGGLGEMKRWLDARTQAFGDEARSFGLPAPKGLLLLGVQGCGKSLSAKAVASFWQFPLLRLDLAAVFGGRESSPESTIREAIKIAESLAPVVLWVDEIEKGFASSEGGGTSDARVFGSFITWLAEKKAEVFVVATANDVSGLPPELLRRGRFDEVFFVDLPNQHERLEILRIHLKKRARDPGKYPGLEKVARLAEHFSGAELEQLVISALYSAFSEKRELSHQDFELAAKHTIPLYTTYEERIKELREWARTRARPAALDSSVLDLFGAR